MALEDPRDKDTRGQRTSGGRTGPAGGSKSTGGGGALGGPKGRQVYSGPIGPMPGTGDPMGNGSHFNETGSGFGGFLDSVFGYENIGQRVNAYKNNPARAGSGINPFVAMVPNYPYASPGYVAASMIGAPMSAPGVLASIPSIGQAIATNSPPESMSQRIAEAMGATRGPRQGDIGVGNDRGARGGNLGGGRALMPQYNAPQGSLTAEAPTNAPTNGQTSLQPQYYQGGQYGVGGPSPYYYSVPNYQIWR